MSEPLPLGLAQQEKARAIDPDQLEKFGKQAADMYSGAGTPLTEAVVEVVKTACLAPEQVKRVCEFANTTAYLAAFEKSGNVRNVTFEGGPANPARVLQDLNDGSSPTLLTESSDYKKASPDFRHAGEMDVLAQAFQHQAEQLSKTASAQPQHQQHANPLDDLLDTKLSLEGVRDELVSMKTGAQLVFDDISTDFAKTAEQAMMDGTCGLAEVLYACGAVSQHQAHVKQAAAHLEDYLGKHGHSAEEIGRSLRGVPIEKRAHAGRIPNPQHPLVVKFAAFTKAAQAVRVVDLAISDVQEQIKLTNKAISGVAI
jgi:hypothetical protein